ncbi:probable 28S ribosomal protein S6, mitochondrial [Drosophila sechellia]|uniref:Small ribosomal subunit protein bS6m n=1 Tax=Drosophila sechellia TaxID=7238 RepID=B4HU53_DROSE|nr:probable 28S ribosomal protein S6, mitochondrial [Drosophila sechellia]EDW50474.1 GM14653 [Drosophila sechellia]
MPSYELALVLRQLPRPELISVIRRTAESILDKGGIIRKLENLGSRALPHKVSEHGVVHREGTHFTIAFDTAPMKIADLKEEFGRDIDIIRRYIFKVEESEKKPCTLHEEMLPPAYRKDVQEIIAAAQKKQKKKFNYNSCLDYYPFQK